MQIEHLFGRRIVPNLLALLHLSVTCYQSGHIPPPLNPEEDGPSLQLLFVTLRLLNPWETRRATDLDIS